MISLSRFATLGLGLSTLVVLGAGCTTPSFFGSRAGQVPVVGSPNTTSTAQQGMGAPLMSEGTIEAWRGPFLDSKRESALWLITQQDEDSNGLVTRGRFSEVGTDRAGSLVQLTRSSDGFTFAFNWGLEEGNQGIATTTRRTRGNGDEILEGEMTMGTSTHSFVLHRDFSLPEFKLIQISTTTYDGLQPRCHFSVAYPQLTQVLGAQESSLSSINTKIVQYLQDGTSTLPVQAEEYVRDCEIEIENQLDELPFDPEQRAMLSYTQQTQPEIVLANKRVISLLFLSVGYTGGAHGMYGYDALTFNPASGTQLELSDVVRPDALQPLIQRMATRLLAESKELLFEKSVTELEKIAAEKKRLSPSEQDALLELARNWYLTDKGITFFFNPYDQGPYAAGIIEVALPYATWKDLATPLVATLLK